MADGGKCHQEKMVEKIPPLIQNGNIVFQAHHVGWIVSGFFALVACVVSFWLINKHLTWYTNKREQRHIVRILFMVPIYAIISFASYLFWNTATPLILVRDGYESIVLASFFYLLLLYVSNDYDQQRLVFLKVGLSKEADAESIRKGDKVKKWCFPLGFIKKKPGDGLYFLQMMKWGILQYSVLRPLTTLAAVILEYTGLYCEISWSPRWGHLYIVVVVSLSVTVAMYCLIQLYIPVAEQLKPRKPLLKLFSVKAVVFLTFWQASFLSLLSMIGVIKDGKYMTAEQINIGLGALLQTFEMMLFSLLHLRAFSYRPYRPSRSAVPEKPNVPSDRRSRERDVSDNGRTPRLRSLAHAMNFYETFREIWQGWLYMWDRTRGREPRFDTNARRAAHLETAFGVTRQPVLRRDIPVEDSDRHHDQIEYTIPTRPTEQSERLSDRVERGLDCQGIETPLESHKHNRKPAEDPQGLRYEGTHQSRQPWWRSVYAKVSQSDQVLEEVIPSRRPSKQRDPPARRHQTGPSGERLLQRQDISDYDDLPPRGIAHSRSRSHATNNTQDEDSLAPLTFFNEHRQRSVYQFAVQSEPMDTLPVNQRNSGDSLLGRVFPSSEGTPSVDHLPSTATHSTPSESLNGHSGSRWKTPRPEFVPYSIQTDSAVAVHRPLVVQQSAQGLYGEIIYQRSEGAETIRASHRRQSAETFSRTVSSPPCFPIPGSSQQHPCPQPLNHAHRRSLHVPRILTIPAPLAQRNSTRDTTTHERHSVANYQSSHNTFAQR